MIMFTGAANVDLARWHSWWPWIPIRLTWSNCQGAKTRKIRWMFIVERRRVYSTGFDHRWIRDEFRDVPFVPYFETTVRDRWQFA